MEAAHGKGIVHRDLKPANIMLDLETGPIVMDFGLARQKGREESVRTRAGQQLGSPAYMPLEQFQGKVEKVGPRSDIYSLGVILFELLTGRRPHEGNAFEIHMKLLDPIRRCRRRCGRSWRWPWTGSARRRWRRNPGPLRLDERVDQR